MTSKHGAHRRKEVSGQDVKALLLYTINRGFEKFAAYEAEIQRLEAALIAREQEIARLQKVNQREQAE